MPRATVLTIGNFDGAHQGHQELVRGAREEVGEAGRVVALSFEPHPVTVLRPQTQRLRLSRFEQRRQWLLAAGASEVVALEPTRELLGQRPEVFVQELVHRYQPAAIVEGPDFRFGQGRAGTIDTLRDLGVAHGFRAIVVGTVEAVLCDKSVVQVRSSLVRWMIERGRVRDASLLLGRPYTLQCRVVPGDQRGRSIGVPTANLDHEDYLLPVDGIYAGLGRGSDGRWYPAAVSVGTKPTFGVHPRTVEAHLIGFEGVTGEYGWTMELQFVEWLREQVAYDQLEPLLDQLRRDLGTARSIGLRARRVVESLASQEV